MKKILTMILALVFILTLCACGKNTAENSASDGGTVSDKGKGTGYVDTWKVVSEDENFPTFYLVLNEDGTGGWGNDLDNLSPRIWYECEEDDAKEGQMELSREDKKGNGNDFYLTEDDKICIEIKMSIGDKSYDQLYFERQ